MCTKYILILILNPTLVVFHKQFYTFYKMDKRFTLQIMIGLEFFLPSDFSFNHSLDRKHGETINLLTMYLLLIQY